MDQDEAPTHSFVVRIWHEQIDGGQPGWRGHIIHVLGNEDRYFQELEVIPEFIRPFLVKMGVRVRAVPRLARWRRLLSLRRSSRKGG